MAVVDIRGTAMGNTLADMLLAKEIAPGDEPSYQLCKAIYEYHPLGLKMAEAPIALAQSMPRTISVQKGPEDRLREAFERQWESDGADSAIYDGSRVSRIYGASALGILVEGLAPGSPIDFATLHEKNIVFNIWDPLNTAGSLVLSQLPNAPSFLKPDDVAIEGIKYHRSRVVVTFNERPIYLGYTRSAFGFVGRSVYQRALFPLQSFLLTMRTDAMVSRKAGVLVMKLKPPGAIINQIAAAIFGLKREVLKDAETNNVMSIGTEDAIESLNMQNLEGPAKMARGNILNNIATAADMPAVMMTNETMTEGFGEGTEDANRIAQWIDRFRIGLAPLYNFMDKIVMHRAWTPEFYKTIQHDFPDQYAAVKYETAFMEWCNSFKAEWPSIIKEPDSEKAKVDEIRLKAVIDLLNVLLPALDPVNKAVAMAWAADNFNELPMLFTSPLVLDMDELKEYNEDQQNRQIEAEKAEADALRNGGAEEGEDAPSDEVNGQDKPSKGRADAGDIRPMLERIGKQLQQLGVAA